MTDRMRDLGRRDFLMLGGASLLGLAAAACSKSSPGDGGATSGSDSLEALTKGKPQTLQAVVAQPLLGRPDDRLSIGLLDLQGKDLKGGTARAWFAQTRTSPLIGPIDLTYHGKGFTRSTYVGRISLDKKGEWLYYVEAKPDGATTTLSGGGKSEVGTPVGAPGQKPQPVPGDTAIVVATPTLKKAGGVSPICTRKPSICSMHAHSLDTSLKAHRPVVLLIGTPAFCESRFCGPVVEQMMKVAAGPLGKKADFIHVELYKDDKNAPASGILAPAPKAWHIESEPVIYYIKPDGSIADWAIGPSDSDEIAATTKTLLGTA